MSTRKFAPTEAWIHAMEKEDCRHHKLLVAEMMGEVVGWCRSFPVDCGSSPRHVELGIGLLSTYRNQGIGSELIVRSLEWAGAAGVNKVELTVSPRNSIAIHVFAKCGFEPVRSHGYKMLMAICLS
jgi:RimJ/RimL family protein N-acetyltransferase